MKKLFIFMLLLFLAVKSHAQPETWFKKANEQYQQENYQKAIAGYDSILKLGIEHPETYYNLGNAHYRLGHLGEAILNYERALKMNADDEDAKHNLTLANKQIVDEFNIVPTPPLGRLLKDVSSLATSGTWTIFALVAFFASLLFSLAYLFKSRSTLFVVLFFSSIAIGIVLEGFAFAAYNYEEENFAIITAANTYVKSAPAKSASDLYILHEGTKIKVLNAFEGWLKVKMPDGKIGWLPQRDLGLI